MPGFASAYGSRPPAGGQQVAPVSPDVQVQRDDDVLTIQDAARRAGVSRAFVLSWIRNGFIEAQTSKQGWLVRAGDIEVARQNAEDSRAGHSVDHPDQNREEIGEDTVLEERQHLPMLAASRYGHDMSVSPFAEFIREQADVLQEQAETIGWLQAELRRLRDAAAGTPASPENSQPNDAQDTVEASAEPVDEAPLGPLDVIAADPFSEEAAQARIMIEETERKITDLWDEHAQRRSRHLESRSPNQSDATWIRRIVSSWKNQEAI